VSGVPYGAFIVPGLMLLAIFSESILNASLGIYMPKFTGTIYEILSAPLSPIETVMGYVGAATTKSLLIGLIIFATAHLFVDLPVAHPFLMLLYLVLVAAAFCLFGFAIGILANGFEQLQVVPLLIVTPMTFLGGAFYSVQILPEPWRTITLFNPVVYLINGFRWTFFGQSDVGVGISLGVSFAFLCACLAFVTIIFRTGWRLKA
jgi:ABC-2 type transport system permease protein